MTHLKLRRSFATLPAALAALALCASGARGQNQASGTPPQKPAEDVVRVETELVQTDVMVFDKQGKFVEGLGREQFEVHVDGRV
ncbi:MAG: hypothetical protein DMF66_10315, partial [Acidobacteria bacterium]